MYLLLMIVVVRMDVMSVCWGRSWMSVCDEVGFLGFVGFFFIGWLGVLRGLVVRRTFSSLLVGIGLVSLY